MNVISTEINGVVIIEPLIFKDNRGYFFESFSEKEFNDKVRPVNFVQDNESRSSYGVIRGLHFQKGEFAQSKLVRVVEAYCSGIIGRKSFAVIYPKRICSWFQCIE